MTAAKACSDGPGADGPGAASAALQKCFRHFPPFLQQLRTEDWPLEVKQRDAREWHGHLCLLRTLILDNPAPNPRRRRQLRELRRLERRLLRWL